MDFDSYCQCWDGLDNASKSAEQQDHAVSEVYGRLVDEAAKRHARFAELHAELKSVEPLMRDVTWPAALAVMECDMENFKNAEKTLRSAWAAELALIAERERTKEKREEAWTAIQHAKCAKYDPKLLSEKLAKSKGVSE